MQRNHFDYLSVAVLEPELYEPESRPTKPQTEPKPKRRTLDASIERDIERAQREETPEEVEALFAALEDGPNKTRHLARIGKRVFDAYLARKLSQDTRPSLRAMRYDKANTVKGRNSAFTQCQSEDYVCDVELTIERSTLTPHQRALLLLLVNMRATEQEIEKCFKGQLFEVWAVLGREFERKKIDLGTYFSPFADTRKRN